MINNYKRKALINQFNQATYSKTDNGLIPMAITSKKLKTSLLTSVLLSSFSFVLFFITLSAKGYVFMDISLIIGLIGYVISVRCIRHTTEYAHLLFRTVLLIIILNSLILSFVIASVFMLYLGI